MVFESVVTDVLNRFLGDYVQNLDANQLKIGIWGGDVVLQNLELKQSALSELDLPVQTVYGRLDKLVLKIPWKNLYGASVEATVEGLCLLVKPNSEVFYDPQKEEIKEQEFKKAQLAKLEQARAMKDVKKTDDSFVEKLVAQIIKNVQLSVKKIHIRYENNSVMKPYAMGITLNSLQLHTTDDNWIRAVVQESVTNIYKIVSMECLSVYWNCDAEMFSNIEDKNELIKCFQRDIANRNCVPENYNYILAPINSDARLILNMKPENDEPPFIHPKSHAQLVIDTLTIGITKIQYRDILVFAESMSLMTKGLPYRKYRPKVTSYKGHYREWWQFAYTCILETEVRRKKRNWDLDHMLSHLRLCKSYGEAYKTKRITGKKIPTDVQNDLDDMEKRLDFFNIVLIRERIELEISKLNVMEKPRRSWIPIVWNPWSTANEQDLKTTNLLSKFQEAMTQEEKDKLFKAIDYQENMKPQNYPVDYVGIVVKFLLKSFQIQVYNEANAPPVIQSKLQNVRCNIHQRPRNDALIVAVKIEKLSLYGMEQDNLLPEIISSQVDETGTLLDVLFETNPLESTYGQKLHVSVQPLKIVHDAATIDKVISIFNVPSNSALEQLSQVTTAQLSNLRDLSATGLQHAIEQHVKIDLDIKVAAPYIILPYGGIYTGEENVLVINLGRLRLKSEDKRTVTVQELAKRGTDRKEMINEMMASSYDRYILNIYNIQVLLAQSDEDWISCIDFGNMSKNKIGEGSPLQILEPVDLNIVLETCLITNDAKLPAMKISAELPSIRVNITDTRLLLLLSLVNSIPMAMEEEELHALVKSTSSASLIKYLDMNELNKKTVIKKQSTDTDLPQLTKLKIDFELKDISIKLSHQEMLSSPIQEVASMNVHSVKCIVIQQTYNMDIDVSLESISMNQWIEQLGESIDIISTPLQNSNCLFNVHLLQVDKRSPKFATNYNSCVSLLSFEFATLNIRLHQEALLELMQFANDVQNQLNDILENPKPRRVRSASIGSSSSAFSQQAARISSQLDPKHRISSNKASIIIIKLVARVQEISIIFDDIKNPISKITIGGISSEVIVKHKSTEIVVKMADLSILDLNVKNIHNKILTVDKGDEAFHINLLIFNREEGAACARPDDVDMILILHLGCFRVSFVNWFIVNMLNFLDGFQAAQKAIAEASEKAARSAKANMQSFYENAIKISLDIHLKAPDILIPESSNSLAGLKIDLGYITITNRFNTLDIHNEAGNPVVIDDLKLKLSQLKIDSIEYDEELEPINNLTMLKPVSFDLEVHRNLSGWYKAVPDVDIVGNMDTIQLMLGTADYKTVMSILNKNLSEGDRNEVEIVKPISSSIPSGRSISKLHRDTGNEAKSSAVNLVDEQIITTLRWNFVMNCFKINLFNTSEIGERVGLAEMSLEGFAVRGRMLSNNSMSNALLLVNCLLYDMRPGREDKINCLLSRTQEHKKEDRGTYQETILGVSRNMIDVTFTKKLDTFVDVRIYSFTFILSIEFLLDLSSFFSTATTEGPVNATKDKTLDTKITTIEESSEDSTMMTLTLKIEKPDIILVENMNSIDTKAIILNSEVQFKIRLLGSHRNINGSIRDFQMYTCIFDELVRESSHVTVIEPVTVSIAGSTPDGKGLHIEVYVTDVFIRVSLYSIEVINKILASMKYTSEQVGSTDDEVVDYSTLWDMKPEEDFWFLKEEEEARDALVVFNLEIKPEDSNRLNELCIMNMPIILITLEAGVGNKTFPMLLVKCGFEGKVRDWSSQLSIDSSLQIQMGYYNSYLALWEPLIEPVSEITSKGVVYRSWELRLEYSINSEAVDIMESSIAVEEQTDESISGSIQPSANTVIDISSSNNLELTITKTCLDVLYNLAKLFSTVDSGDGFGQNSVKAARFRVINITGMPIDLLLKEKEELTVVGGGQTEGNITIRLETGAEIELDLKKQSNSINDYIKMLEGQDKTVDERFLSIIVPQMQVSLRLPIVRADTRYFMIRKRGINWGLVSCTTVDNGVTIVTLSSNLKVHNDFMVPIDMYYMRESGNELEFISTIAASSSLYVPMKAVYSPTSELFFSVANYSVTATPYVWRDLQLNVTLTKNLTCSSKRNKDELFVIRAVGEMSQVYFENTLKHTMTSTIYDIFLRPAVTFKNCLPLDVMLSVQDVSGEILIKSGDSMELPNVNPGQSYLVIRLPSYLEKVWSCQKDIRINPSQFSVWTFESFDSTSIVSIDLGMHTFMEKDSFLMTLYCPFWMLNKTGLQLSYRSTDENTNILYHPAHFKGPILFSFNSRNFFGKKKACVRVEDGEWSEKFSIDVAGSSGVVICKTETKIYQIGVTNRLTYNGLSKQIIFTPYFVIINNAPLTVECQELERPGDPWVVVESNSCAALWPVCERDDKLIRIRIADTSEISAPFLFTESHTTLLKLKNKYGGINVDIQLTEGAVYINFAMYDKGMAPALIINDTRHTMNIWEKESVQIRKLPSAHQMFYTWDNPSGQRVLVWEGGYKKELDNDLRMDGVGEYAISENSNVYWVSFLDGMQRILLFTSRQTVAENAQISKQFERVDREITVSIYGVGLSIVNNLKRQEVMYIGIASTGIIWETCKNNGKRFKQMSTKDNIMMEKSYQLYLLKDISGSDVDKLWSVDNKTEVNFITFEMIKPHKKKIRRRFQTGLWMQMKSSPHQMQIHAKVNRLQIDNQMYDCTFPVMLAPVAPPKSIAVNNAHKPFAELSIVQLLIKNSQIRQFKYFKILIQEFHIKVDMGFINAIMEVFTSTESEADVKEKFISDLNLANEPLYSLVSTHSIQEQKSFYDLLHFSPLKIHVSFSMSSGGISNTNMPNFLNVLLQGIGVTLTDLQDVIFKLAFFEREYSFLTQRQLISETTTHYVGQTVKQLYVLVFGLDVIGNPYGLVIGISQGVEDLFYEPIQGAIQGPGEFAEGLALGVRSLFGHTVGGAAGAVSRITGAMGKGIAALTFDKEYQRKRRDQINKKPATVQEGIARGGKGLVMGVFDGVTGVFTKPITGAKEQGVGGFFKGLGKGAVGLVTRPTAGVMDFASTSFDTVKRVTDFGHEEVTRLRAPRYVRADHFVRPYDVNLAAGNKLLCELEKGKYYNTDIYSCHFVIIEKKEVLLMSDKRMAYIVHNDLFGGWQVHWSVTWPELATSPLEVNQGVQISLESKKKNLLYGSDNYRNKIILVEEKEIRQKIIREVIDHMKVS